jgi:succinate dehydrogenase/fumarate reductase flavoprotein subunit
MASVTDGSGTIIAEVAAGQYPFTPLSPGQHNLALVSSTGLTAPTGATYAIVQAAGATVKYTTDGATTPTATVGMTLGVGSSIALSGAQVIANFRAISATGTLDVEFFK